MISIKEAVDVIRDFLDRGEFIYTFEFVTSDGAHLKTDWGYFEEGLDEIERYIGEREDEGNNKLKKT